MICDQKLIQVQSTQQTMQLYQQHLMGHIVNAQNIAQTEAFSLV